MAIQITASATRAVEMLQGIAVALKNFIKTGTGGVYHSLLNLFSARQATSIRSRPLDLDDIWGGSAASDLHAGREDWAVEDMEEGFFSSAFARQPSLQADVKAPGPAEKWQLSVPEDAFLDKQTGETDVRKMLFSKRFAQALSVFDATEEIRQNSQACFNEINQLLKNHRLADTFGPNNTSLAAELGLLSLSGDVDFVRMKKMQGDDRVASQQAILTRLGEGIRQLSEKSVTIRDYTRKIQVPQVIQAAQAAQANEVIRVAAETVQVPQAIQTAQAVQPRANRTAANKKSDEAFQQTYVNYFKEALRTYSAPREVAEAKKQVMISLDKFLQKFDSRFSQRIKEQMHNALDKELKKVAKANDNIPNVQKQKTPFRVETLKDLNEQLKKLDIRFYGE